MTDVIPIGEVPETPGEMPKKMLAWCIRPDREGDPETAMKLEEVDVPNTPVGRIKFDDTHQAFINMLLVEINGGQLKVLEKIPIQP